MKKNRNFHHLFKKYKNLYYLKGKTNNYYMLSEADAAHKHYMNHIHDIFNLVQEKTKFQRAGKVLDFQKIARQSILDSKQKISKQNLDMLSTKENIDLIKEKKRKKK